MVEWFFAKDAFDVVLLNWGAHYGGEGGKFSKHLREALAVLAEMAERYHFLTVFR
jgi:hypothetical protein